MRTVFALVALLLSGHLASSVSRAVAANPVASRCSYPLLPTPRARPPHSPDPSTIVTQEPLVTALDRNESAVEATTLDNLIAGSWGQLFRAGVSNPPPPPLLGPFCPPPPPTHTHTHTGRLVSQTCLHPVDVMRTRAQVAGRMPTRLHMPTLVLGLTPQAAFSAPAGAIQFGSMAFAKRLLVGRSAAVRNATGAGRMALDLGTMAVGTFAASVVRVPQELLKQRIQAGLYANFGNALKTIWAKGGLPAFYRGWTATVVRDIPWNAIR